MSEIILQIKCEKCNIYFEEGSFDYDICNVCAKNIKNKCEICGKIGRWNFNYSEYGIRCRNHKENCMIDTMNIIYCERRFIKNIEDKLGGNVIGEYKGNEMPVECICKEGHQCFPCPNSIRNGRGMCNICVRHDPETSKINFVTSIEEKLGGKVIGEYKNKNIPVECICKFGHVCNPRPNDIQQGHGMCNRCCQSGGELFISHVLEKLNIKFKTEVNNDLIMNNFRFDFYFEYNNNKYYLEFDGIQHFQYLKFFHKSGDRFLIHQQRDIFKNYIAKISDIKMIRISYRQIKDKSIKDFSITLKDLIENNLYKDLIVCHESYSNWIYGEPSNETIEMYCK